MRQNRTILLPWLLGGTLATLGLAFALYWTRPGWKLARGHLVPLRSADTADVCRCLTELCAQAGLKYPPIFVWNPLNPARTGLAFGRIGRYYVALSGGLVTTFYTDPDAFRAVVLHELAHLRNGDVDKTYWTISIWQSFVVTALLPFAASRWHTPLKESLALGWRVVALTLIVFTMRNAILRTREFYADVRASVWEGSGGALARVLSRLPDPGTNRWLAWLTVHPAPADRCHTLADDASLFRMHFWDAFGAGVAGALAVPHLRTLFLEMIESQPLTLSGPPLLLMTFVMYAIGMQIWRARFASAIRHVPATSSDGLGFGLAAGIFCGKWVSFSGVGVWLPESASQVAAAIFWGIVLPGIVLACYLRWVAATATVWLEVAFGRASVRWIYRWSLLVAGVSFGAIYSGIDLISVLAKKGSDMALMGLVVFPLEFKQCLLVATVCWAFPLASYLRPFRTSGETVPAWAFLDGIQQIPAFAQRPPLHFKTTLRIGAVGAVLSLCTTVGASLAIRLSPGLGHWARSSGQGYLYGIGIIALPAVIAAITALLVRKRVRRLALFQGMFAAALTSWIGASGWLVVKASFRETTTVNSVLGGYTQFVDTGLLASLLLLVGVPAVGRVMGRVFGATARQPQVEESDAETSMVVQHIPWRRKMVFGAAVVGICAGAALALYVQVRRSAERLEAIDKRNASAPGSVSTTGGSAVPAVGTSQGAPVAVYPYPQMVRIAAGTLNMGSPQDEAGRDKDEGPVHRVTIPAFELARTPVTRAQFAVFVRESGYVAGGNCSTVYRKEWLEETKRWWQDPGFPQDDSHPVVCVTWLDAQAYVDWLRRKTGRAWRLPSEAEWEYAARAGTTTTRFWGGDFDAACAFANVRDRSGQEVLSTSLGAVSAKCDDSYAYTSPVGRFRPNAFGLYDMLGNVWQAVQDCWHPSYEGAPVDGSAWISGECDHRVSRGGAWNSGARNVRSATRAHVSPEERAASAGFRVARSIAQGGEVAGNSRAWPWCTREDRQAISPDSQVSGCTTVIGSGTESQANLAVAFTNRCSAYREKGDFDRAIPDCDEALRLKPDSAWALNNRGGAYQGKGDNDRAIEDYTQAIRLLPGYAGAFINRGVAWHAKKEYDRAIADFNEAIRLKPDDAYALDRRCWTRAAANKELEAALADCNESLRLSPGNPAIFDNRGFVYLRLARYDSAIADYSASLERVPKSASSLYGRGLARRRNHDEAAGDADLSAAQAIDPTISKAYAELGARP